MRLINFIILAIFVHLNSIAQEEKRSNKLELMQGIWENIKNTELEYSYKITRGIKSLGISHTNDSNRLDFYLLESLEGFQDYRYDDIDSININSLNESGKHFTSIIYKEKIDKKGWVKMEYCIVPEYFDCNGENMSINGGELTEFYKISKLPISTIRLLFYRGKLDKRDYIKEYLNIKVFEIISYKCVVYSEPENPTQIQLVKGDIVTLLLQKGKWLKVNFGEDKVGWIRKEDTK